ncbi:ribosome-inactivating family protein [Streptomyces sp. NPDC008122]|uniref:ribosome-inactivating family protein n=1 Tax=Streptomyces sp. NPDC008122 TaxID=3364810 RepID=UPI0036E7586B
MVTRFMILHRFRRAVGGLLALVIAFTLVPTALVGPAYATEGYYSELGSRYTNLIESVRNRFAAEGSAATSSTGSRAFTPRDLGQSGRYLLVSLDTLAFDGEHVQLVVSGSDLYVQGYYLPGAGQNGTVFWFSDARLDSSTAFDQNRLPRQVMLGFASSYQGMENSELSLTITGGRIQTAISQLAQSNPDSPPSSFAVGNSLAITVVAIIEAARNRGVQQQVHRSITGEANTAGEPFNTRRWADVIRGWEHMSREFRAGREWTFNNQGAIGTVTLHMMRLWLALLANPNRASQPMCSGDPSTGSSPECPQPGPDVPDAPKASTDAAYSYIADDQDEFGTDGLGVPRSYTGGFFGPGDRFGDGGYQSSFTYDNAVTIIALAKGAHPDLSRAARLGDSLLYAQGHDPENDGRIRASYLPDPFVTTLGRDYPAGTPYIGGWSVYTGNMAWAGMAFCHLYEATGNGDYLDGALRAADWIQSNSADDRGAGGYTGGYADTSAAEDGSGMVERTWKATEHNIDVGAFFSMLNRLTGDPAWKDRSDHAFAFVKTMLSADGNHLWTGTGLDGVTVNEDAVPEDVQTWSYLATLDPAYERVVDWAAGRMAATDGPADATTGEPMFKGVSFGAMDTSKVWFEGTAHLLTAYHVRNGTGDAAKAAVLQKTLENAQTSAPHNDGRAIVAASGDGLDTGQGDLYYASRHTGATAWYLLAGVGANPFRL